MEPLEPQKPLEPRVKLLESEPLEPQKTQKPLESPTFLESELLEPLEPLEPQ